MNQADFDNCIENTVVDYPISPDVFRNILSEYPYCQSAHLLYSRSLRISQHIGYSSQLRIAAAYAGDRSVLKSYLDSDASPDSDNVNQADTEQSFNEVNFHPDPELTAEQEPQSEPDSEQAFAADNKKLLSKEEIVSRFIQKEPSITRPQGEFFNPVNYAKQSVIDNETIVSETLATIFLRQGHMDKAIKVYEKLSLVFPEKSTYFANLIEKVKSERK